MMTVNDDVGSSTVPRPGAADARDKCGSCPETAAELVWDSLTIQDGVLWQGNRPEAEFLKRHDRLQTGKDPVLRETVDPEWRVRSMEISDVAERYS